MMGAEQIAATATGLDGLWDVWPGGAVIRASSGDGPYHLVVAVNAARAPHPAALALAAFPGVTIASQDQFSHPTQWRATRPASDVLTLHVLPKLVRDVLEWLSDESFALDAHLSPPAFTNPPTEADMAAVFIHAMSFYDLPAGAYGLGRAVTMACKELGWRTVAALVCALDAQTRECPQDMAAVLHALIATPAARQY